jgi:2-polyprenyl-6-methoxyphenol hydroxylase-like FAD-dependent oxidoreductase
MSETRAGTAKKLRIAIIGGGSGGLTLAVALRQRGIAADVYEQSPELTEIGAAVALSANSTRELGEDRFGVRIPDEDLERFETVGDVVDYVRHARADA